VHWVEFLTPVLAMGSYGVVYALRCRTLAAEGRGVPHWRQACFAAGAILVVAAVTPPLDGVADRLLAAHMAQHVLLGDLGALLIALGLTGPLLQPILRQRVNRALRRLSHPVAAFALWALDLYAWHAPFAYQAALRDDVVHTIEHASFFVFGLNMWFALLGPLPKPAWFGNLARLGYVIAVRLTSMLLANVFLWSGTVFYPYYASGERQYGIGPLQDQGIAGAIMMVTDSVVTLGLFGWLFMRTAAESERKQELIEFAASRDVALTPERAARAVASGREGELRARLAAGEGLDRASVTDG
jgi:cytochrome c oxidase assembly factor CtaG